MNRETNRAMESSILELYASLCREAVRCIMYSLRAAKEGRTELVSLFSSLGISLNNQANRLMMQVRGSVGSIDDAAEEVYSDILPASVEKYLQLTGQAEQMGSKALVTGFSHYGKVQRKNISLYQQALRDTRQTDYHVCNFCGYVCRDKAPENCPICTAPKQRFTEVSSK